MEVLFSPETEAKIARAAASAQTGPSEYVRQVVERELDYDDWLRAKVAGSLAQLDRGEFLTHEEVGSRIAERFRS